MFLSSLFIFHPSLLIIHSPFLLINSHSPFSHFLVLIIIVIFHFYNLKKKTIPGVLERTLMTMLGKSNMCTSSGSSMPFLVTMICFGCSSTGIDRISAATCPKQARQAMDWHTIQQQLSPAQPSPAQPCLLYTSPSPRD